MFDIGWTELLVIGIVALIVVGPKDLPVMFRTLGEYTGRAKAMAREFTRAMESAADEAGVKDIQKDFRNMANPKKMGLDALNEATRDLAGLEEDARGRGGAKAQGGAKGESGAKPGPGVPRASEGPGDGAGADPQPAGEAAPAATDDKTA